MTDGRSWLPEPLPDGLDMPPGSDSPGPPPEAWLDDAQPGRLATAPAPASPWDALPPSVPPAAPLPGPPVRSRRPLALVAAVVAGTVLVGALAHGRAPVVDAAPAAGTAADVSYAFLQTNGDGSPVSYESCGPLRFVVDPTGGPEGGTDTILRAFTRMTRATGVQFEFAGETAERPVRERPARQSRYGSGYAPILVAWSDPAETPRLEGDVIGLGGSSALRSRAGAASRYVTGTITIDAPQSRELLARRPRTGMRVVEGVVLHELGHVLGLDHVDDASQLMNGEGGADVLGPGDVAGLQVMYGDCLGASAP